jgi:trimethylamine:corrinoid methyltransferase-like protein
MVTVVAEKFAYDVIRAVGPARRFSCDSAHMCEGQRRSAITKRQGRTRWAEEGALQLREKARRKAQHMLVSHAPVPLTAEQVAWIDELVNGFVPKV